LKKLVFLLLIFSLLLTACANERASSPTLPDEPIVPDTPTEPEQPDEPILPETPTEPEQPDEPILPDTPTEPFTPSDVPSKPDEPIISPTPSDVPSKPDEPEKPIEPTYPDISGFDRDDRSIVYAAAKLDLIEPKSSAKVGISKDHALISLGTADTYTVIFYKDVLYLTQTTNITTEHPKACKDKENELGGTLYLGGEKIVAIDAGHQSKGMYDKEPIGPGSSTLKTKVAAGTEGVSTKIAEYVLNLNVSLILRDELISRGYTVVMIRETHDVRISNAERAQMANAYKADAFIRVHANGSDNKNARGALAIFQTKENQWCGELYEQSKLLSETVLAAYCKNSGIENDGNWETDTMTGINWTTVPSTIIELGYMSNADEDKLMATSAFHKAAAVGIAQGIDNYFEKIK